MRLTPFKRRFGKTTYRPPFRHSFQPGVEWLEPRLAPANVDVLTYHYDGLLSGNNPQETSLTPSNVHATNFGQLFSQPVDGQIYATPLYKANLVIPGNGTHNVAFVVTEHDSVYAFDADTGTQLWQRSFINPAGGVTPIPSSDTSSNIFPEYGITGTPVIDAGTNTMYVVAQTKEVIATTAHYVDRLHATDKTTGSLTGSQSGITVNPAAASSLIISGFPSPITAGTLGGVLVTAEDPFGNVATNYQGTVHLTSSDPQAQLQADHAFTAADGSRYAFAAALKTAGTQSITATDTVNNSITGTQGGIVVNPAGLITLQVTGFPSPITAGTPGSFTVTAQDAYGNTIMGYTGTVHFSSSDGQAQLPDDYTFTAGDNGTHTFSATLFTAGSQSLTAKDAANLLTGTQSDIVVTPAATSAFVVSGYPSPTGVGEFHDFTVAAVDAYGNVTPDYTGTVTFSSDDGLANLPGDYTFTAADMGVQVFSAAFNQVGTFSLTATDTTDPSITGTQSGIEVTSSGGPEVSQGNGPALNPAAALGLASSSGATSGPASRVQTVAVAPEPVAPGQANPDLGGPRPLAADAVRTRALDQLFVEFTGNGALTNSLDDPLLTGVG
jgi:hypothetical protein